MGLLDRARGLFPPMFTYARLEGEPGAADEPTPFRLVSALNAQTRGARRYVLAALSLCALVFLGYRQHQLSSGPVNGVDWSRFAYTQYVTNDDYLCNSVMIFEALHRLGSRADRVMMYPDTMHGDATEAGSAAALLSKAHKEYNVHLVPVSVIHKDGTERTWADSFTKLLAFNQTQYDRVLNLDSDATVLQSMDELFLLPTAPVAMPRAYWLDDGSLSDQIILIEPSDVEFGRIEQAIREAGANTFDMDIVDTMYHDSALVIPHRRYDMLTGELRREDHVAYLGNDYEKWDPAAMVAEAKFLHFSDWPVPKPWIPALDEVLQDHQPPCSKIEGGDEDCGQRDLWLSFYEDFRTRRSAICGRDVEAPDMDLPDYEQ